MAADARPVRDPRLGDDAPADAGRARRAALPRLARALADGRVARAGAAGRRDPLLAGPGLQPAGGEPSPGCAGDRGARLARGPGDLAGRRPVHRCRTGVLRPRGGRPPARRQRAAGARTVRRLVRRRLCAGAHGSRRHRLPGPRPTVRDLPARPGCPSRGRRFEPLRRQSRFEGSFRQRRGQTLRLLAAGPRPLGDLDTDAVGALAADGLVAVADGVASLP